MFATAIGDAGLLTRQARHALLQRAVLFVDAPDAGKAFLPLRHAVDQVIIALVGGGQESIDDVAVRQLGRAPGGAWREESPRLNIPRLRGGERVLGPILKNEHPRVWTVDRPPTPPCTDGLIRAAADRAPH